MILVDTRTVELIQDSSQIIEPTHDQFICSIGLDDETKRIRELLEFVLRTDQCDRSLYCQYCSKMNFSNNNHSVI